MLDRTVAGLGCCPALRIPSRAHVYPTPCPVGPHRPFPASTADQRSLAKAVLWCLGGEIALATLDTFWGRRRTFLALLPRNLWGLQGLQPWPARCWQRQEVLGSYSKLTFPHLTLGSRRMTLEKWPSCPTGSDHQGQPWASHLKCKCMMSRGLRE